MNRGGTGTPSSASLLTPKEITYVRRITMPSSRPERKKMMQAWADYLEGIKSGAKIIPIGARG